MLPKLIRTRGRHDRRQAQIAYFAGHGIGQQQTAGVWTRDVHVDVCHCGAKRTRMKSQRLAHAGNVAQPAPRERTGYSAATAGFVFPNDASLVPRSATLEP